MMVDSWVYCIKGQGYLHGADGVVSSRLLHFKTNSVGLLKGENGNTATVWLIGRDEVWDVPKQDVKKINVLETGDKYDKKICNICHCVLPVSEFALNQNNLHGVVRRPTCKKCRTDIDKRAPKSRQTKQAEKNRPQKGAPFKYPICQKRSIVGVTAKIVADHDHRTGNIRDFICDSCNTGLGRFKNGEDYLKNAIAYLEEREM